MASNKNVDAKTSAKLSKVAKGRTRKEGKFATEVAKPGKAPKAKKTIIDPAKQSTPVNLAETVSLISYYSNAMAACRQGNPEQLDSLAKNGTDQVRDQVASNPNTSQETFAFLLENKDPYLRFLVARNRNTSAKVLEDFIDANPDKVDDIFLQEVLANRKTSLELQKKVLKHPTIEGAQTSGGNYILNNIELDASIFEELIIDCLQVSDVNISQKSRKRCEPKYSVEARVSEKIASNRYVSKALLSQLVNSTNDYTRDALARNPNIDTEDLKRLKNDPCEQVASEAKWQLKARGDGFLAKRRRKSRLYSGGGSDNDIDDYDDAVTAARYKYGRIIPSNYGDDDDDFKF